MATGASTTLGKGLRLLSAIVADEGRTSLGAIADSLGLPLATAHRLALALMEEGYLERLQKGYFIPGPVFPVLASPRQRAAIVLRGGLARLADRYGAFAHFGVLDEGMVTYLVKEGRGKAGLFTSEQSQLEAYCSGIGKVLLAALPEGDLEVYLAGGPFVALTANTLTDPDLIRAAVDQIRKTGVGYDRCEIREDLFCIAVPVRTRAGETIGAISLTQVGHVPDTSEQTRIIRQLRALAKSASGLLPAGAGSEQGMA